MSLDFVLPMSGSYRERPVNPPKVPLSPYYPDRPVERVNWLPCFKEVQNFNRKVDGVLTRLDRENFTDNTIVRFGDNTR